MIEPRFIGDKDGSETIRALFEESNRIKTAHDTRKKWLEDQIEKYNKEVDVANDEFWKKAEQTLREQNIISSDMKKVGLKFNKEGQLFLQDHTNGHGECGCLSCMLGRNFR